MPCPQALTVSVSPRTLPPGRRLPRQPGEAALTVRADSASLMLVLCVTLAASVLSASFAVPLAR